MSKLEQDNERLLECIEAMARHIALAEWRMSCDDVDKYWQNYVPAKYRDLVLEKDGG